MSVVLLNIKYANINQIMDVPFKRSKKGITFKVKIEPKSSKKGISGIVGEAIKIRVNAAPVRGAANEELIEILSEEFCIKKAAIKIIRGHFSRDKVVEIEGMDSLN
jgi:uncharacterized protein (TIGR00251 family)